MASHTLLLKAIKLHLNFFTAAEETALRNSHFLQLRNRLFSHADGPAFTLAGFIDFIVYPTFSLLTDMAEKIVIPLVEENPGPPDPCNRHRYTHRQGMYHSDTCWNSIQIFGYDTGVN